MAIASQVSANELADTVQERFIDQAFEVALVDSGGATYNPETTVDATWMANEVPEGTGGYTRQTITYATADIAPYSDQGIGLATKAAIFDHDGGATTINFSHVVLLRGNGNILSVGTVPTQVPTTTTDLMTDGVFVGLPTVTTGVGTGCTVTITIANQGVNGTSDYSAVISDPGRNYDVADTIEITAATLIATGACSVDLGNILVSPLDVQVTPNPIVSVSPSASPVVLGNGNEAVFYFNTKIFGFADADG